jgi:DNA-binding PucR family transcriptional regulator
VICLDEQPAQEADLPEALEYLRQTVALAELAGDRGRIGPDARLPELLLARSPRIARRLRDSVFGPLRAHERPDLERTLASLAEHGFERSATAAALDIHRNTLSQRIARIEGLTGLDLDAIDDRGLIWLAARCAPCTPD